MYFIFNMVVALLWMILIVLSHRLIIVALQYHKYCWSCYPTKILHVDYLSTSLPLTFIFTVPYHYHGFSFIQSHSRQNLKPHLPMGEIEGRNPTHLWILYRNVAAGFVLRLKLLNSMNLDLIDVCWICRGAKRMPLQALREWFMAFSIWSLSMWRLLGPADSTSEFVSVGRPGGWRREERFGCPQFLVVMTVHV